jgi:excinuclease ABC subunit B
VLDDPTAKFASSPSPGGGGSRAASARGGVSSKIHKPALDEMGIALHHEVAPHRPAATQSSRARKPSLDEMGPGVESIPGKRESTGPRSTLGRPGMRGGFKPRRR